MTLSAVKGLKVSSTRGLTEGTRLSVVLAAEMDLVRGALRTTLSLEPDLAVVGEAAHGGQVVGTASRLRPKVVVIDLQLPGLNGVEVVEALRSACPQTNVVMLAERPTLNQLREAVAAGVCGFVPMSSSVTALTSTIRAVARGESVLHPDLVTQAMRMAPCPLTARELSVLQGIGSGASVAEVASSLCLSQGTVRNYVSAVLSKTGARNRVDALRIARDNGWVSA